MNATPEDAVRAMQELTKALRENTKISAAVGQQLYIANQLAMMSNGRIGGGEVVKAILAAAGRAFARGA